MSDNLTPFVDMTGQMSDIDMIQQNIGQIMDEMNRTSTDFTNFNETIIILDNQGNHRILLGTAPDGQIGLFITKPGFDILKQFTLP
jgi:hypothetical protein